MCQTGLSKRPRLRTQPSCACWPSVSTVRHRRMNPAASRASSTALLPTSTALAAVAAMTAEPLLVMMADWDWRRSPLPGKRRGSPACRQPSKSTTAGARGLRACLGASSPPLWSPSSGAAVASLLLDMLPWAVVGPSAADAEPQREHRHQSMSTEASRAQGEGAADRPGRPACMVEHWSSPRACSSKEDGRDSAE